MSESVCVCVRACVRACVRVCVCVCVRIEKNAIVINTVTINGIIIVTIHSLVSSAFQTLLF